MVGLDRPFWGHMGQLQLLDTSTTRENTWLIASAQIVRETLFKTAFFRTSNPNPLVLKVEAAQNDYRRQNIGFYCEFL